MFQLNESINRLGCGAQKDRTSATRLCDVIYTTGGPRLESAVWETGWSLSHCTSLYYPTPLGGRAGLPAPPISRQIVTRAPHCPLRCELPVAHCHLIDDLRGVRPGHLATTADNDNDNARYNGGLLSQQPLSAHGP
ncbi:hypothetical protein J6590_063788 [Homalodisca vitripennis]|nr:hypothetical protein J6590_063788 [Homalodisca vitripennis]